MKTQKDYQRAYNKICRRIKSRQRKIDYLQSKVRKLKYHLEKYNALTQELDDLLEKMVVIEEEAKQNGFKIKL